MGIKDFWQAGQVALSANRLADRAFYAQVAEEMRQGIRDEALWLMAYEQASGDETQTRANYIGLRVRALKDEAVIMGAVADAQKPVEPAKPEATPPLQTPPVVDVSIIKVTITIIGMTWAIMWIAYVLAS